jgi:hypothetical protein
MRGIVLIFILFIFSCTTQKTVEKFFHPGEIWNDTDGNPVNAHGGGILFHEDTYYWYGEIKQGETWLVKDLGWECYRVNAGGFSCYSSKNLYDWKFEGVALEPDKTDSTSHLHISQVLERPKVIFNESTRKFVMWFHTDSENYKKAEVGVAICDSPAGPFEFIESMRPNGNMSRDMTLFKDDEGKAYHIYSSEDNATLHISLLSNDYLKPTGVEKRIFIGLSREAPAMFKRKNKYYLVTSGCTGWSPNPALIAVSDSILGEWKMLYNPCIGKGSEITFNSQSTFVLPVQGKNDEFIFLADRWNKTNLPDSRYVWLPLVFKNDSAVIEWKESWNLNDF